MRKRCCSCNQLKDLDHFHKHSRSKDGRVSRCKICAKTSNRMWFERRKTSVLTNRRKKIKELLNISNNLKEAAGCIVCKEKDCVCLEWHHINPAEKESNITRLIENNSSSKFYEEIKKCIVVCSNCHKKIHAGRMTQTEQGTMLLIV